MFTFVCAQQYIQDLQEVYTMAAPLRLARISLPAERLLPRSDPAPPTWELDSTTCVGGPPAPVNKRFLSATIASTETHNRLNREEQMWRERGLEKRLEHAPRALSKRSSDQSAILSERAYWAAQKLRVATLGSTLPAGGDLGDMSPAACQTIEAPTDALGDGDKARERSRRRDHRDSSERRHHHSHHRRSHRHSGDPSHRSKHHHRDKRSHRRHSSRSRSRESASSSSVTSGAEVGGSSEPRRRHPSPPQT